MPTESDHIALANRNDDALNCLLQDPAKYSEWIATAAFYKAVQVVEAAFTKAGQSTHDHRTRHQVLKTKYPDFWKHYRTLWQSSCIARYLHDNDQGTSYKSFSDYMPSDTIRKRLVEKRLRPVEQLMVSSLSDDARNALQRVPS